MTGGAVAELDDVFALRLERKMGVECRNAVDARGRKPDGLCDVADQILGEPSVTGLNALKNGNQTCLVIVVFLEDLFRVLHSRSGFRCHCCLVHLSS